MKNSIGLWMDGKLQQRIICFEKKDYLIFLDSLLIIKLLNFILLKGIY